MTPDEWHAWRRAGITATDVADAAQGTYGGAYGVVASKLGLAERDVDEVRAERGHAWEDTIAAGVEALTGLTVLDTQACAEYEHDPRWRCTLDGLLYPYSLGVDNPQPTAVLELKTRGVEVYPNRDRWADQVQWQMLVTGLPRALIAEAVIEDATDSLAGLWLREVQADPARQWYLESIAADLWGHVEAGTLPDPTEGTELEPVKAVHAVADDELPAVDLADLEATVRQLDSLRASIADAENERKRLEAMVRDRIGSATHGVAGELTVNVSRPARELTAEGEAQLLEDHPEYGRLRFDRRLLEEVDPKCKLLDKYRTPTGARRLTIKRSKRT
jgi:hypothetical protein